MQGYVLAFRPATGSGTIVSDAGQAYSFNDSMTSTDFQGGDWVTFEAATIADGRSGSARDVRLVERGVERLTNREKPLLRRLQTTLKMHA